MTTTDDLEHWDLNKLEMVMGASQDANQSLKILGDTLDGSRDSLWNWGGDAAATWRAQHGKIRADIDAQGHQTQAMHDELGKLYPEVKAVKDDYENFKQSLPQSGLSLQSPGIVVSDDPGREADVATAQTQLNGILKRATAVDHELADALRSATTPAAPPPTTTDTPPPPPQPNPGDGKTTSADQLPLPTPGGHAPFPTEATRDNNSPDISRHLADNPHPAPLLAGLSADQWHQRLANYQPGDPLPDPRTPTGDKAIDSLGYAAGQQNTTYAWGANKSKDGPSQGQGDTGQGANQNHDWDRYGYDCGGLVRYSVEQGAGFDVGQGTNSIDSNSHFARPGGGLTSSQAATQALPGDVLVFGGSGGYQGSGTDHTGIYIGNGYMINAPESGEPVRVDKVGSGRGTTDILRLPSS